MDFTDQDDSKMKKHLLRKSSLPFYRALIIIFCMSLCIEKAYASDTIQHQIQTAEIDTIPKRNKSRTLPIGGDELREKGMYVELPFAVGLDATTYRGVVNITDLALRFRDIDDEFIDVSDFAQIGDVVNSGWTMTARAEANILPFFKVFAIGGYAGIDLKMKVRVGENGDNDPFYVEINDKNNFYTAGMGGSVFFGLESFFGAVDLTYITTLEDDNTKDPTTNIESLISGVRVGYANPNQNQRQWAIWTGFSRTSSTVDIQGTVNEVPVIGTLDYKVKQRAIDRNSILFGGQYGLSDRIQFILDSDYAIRNQYRFTFSVNYRF